MPSSSASSKPSQPSAQAESAKPGFFAAAGQRLKRALSGAPPAPESQETHERPTPQEPQDPSAAEHQPHAVNADGDVEIEVETSVQARARELVQGDRAHGRGRGQPSEAADQAHAEASASPEVSQQAPTAARATPPPLPRRADTGATPPPPLPTETIADNAPAAVETGLRLRKSTPPPLPTQHKNVVIPAKRARRDAKTAELRARLGAAKAQLAETQARLGNQPPQQASSASAETLPIATLDLGDEPHQTPTHADVTSGHAQANESLQQAPTETAEQLLDAQPSADDPIRTLTIARLLAGQGYFERSLSIYDELLAHSDDPELRAEAEKVRGQLAAD